jgi:hypothetical protein
MSFVFYPEQRNPILPHCSSGVRISKVMGTGCGEWQKNLNISFITTYRAIRTYDSREIAI